MIVYVFEGKTTGENNKSSDLFYDHSLSVHETFEGAKQQLKFEASMLMDNGFEIQSHNDLDKSGEKHIQCVLVSCLAERRVLEVTEWVVRE